MSATNSTTGFRSAQPSPLMQIICQIIAVVKASKHPDGKETERGKRDRTARGHIQLETMNVSKVETEGGTEDGTDRHGVAHDGYWAVQCTFA